MNFPTLEQVRIAVQSELQMTGTPLVAVVTEASHGIGGPVYAVAFYPAEVIAPAEATPV